MANQILVVEDDAFLRSAYMAKLTKAGFTVNMATDGIEAMEMLEKIVPDVILLDLVMPRKDGFSTLEDISKNEKFSKIPVIVASNLGQPEEIARVQSMGAKDFIIKSNLSLEELIEKINKIIKASK